MQYNSHHLSQGFVVSCLKNYVFQSHNVEGFGHLGKSAKRNNCYQCQYNLSCPESVSCMLSKTFGNQGNQERLLNQRKCTENTADCTPFHEGLRSSLEKQYRYLRDRLSDTELQSHPSAKSNLHYILFISSCYKV